LGKKEGAKLLIGETPGSGDDGYFIKPHIFTEVKPEMKVTPLNYCPQRSPNITLKHSQSNP
jgi:hypothetical protein